MQLTVQQKMFKGIDRWRQSGLSQRAWCEKNNVGYGTFHYWYRRYRQIEPPVPCAGDGFVRLMVEEEAGSSGSWCELVLADGRRLVFHQAVGADFLNLLIG